MVERVRAIRGATTAAANTPQSIAEAVTELLDHLLDRNPVEMDDVVNVIFSVTPDLNTIYPAQVARSRPGWDQVPLLDLQQMQVTGGLACCIRVLMQINTQRPRSQIHHVYLRGAKELRPDLETQSLQYSSLEARNLTS